MPVRSETALQIGIKKFVSDCVDVDHLFLAFDRSRDVSGQQHMWEKVRGIKAGTPDTLLLVPGQPAIFCELKTPGNRPTPVQEFIGQEVQKAGHQWFWADTVQAYRMGLMMREVPLRANAYLVAEHRDALILSAKMKAEQTPKKRSSSKSFTAKPSSASIRKMNAVRSRIPF